MTTSRGCVMRRSASSETCTSPSTGPSIRANAPKVTSLVTVLATIWPTSYFATTSSHCSGEARRIDRPIFFDSLSILVM